MVDANIEDVNIKSETLNDERVAKGAINESDALSDDTVSIDVETLFNDLIVLAFKLSKSKLFTPESVTTFNISSFIKYFLYKY